MKKLLILCLFLSLGCATKRLEIAPNLDLSRRAIKINTDVHFFVESNNRYKEVRTFTVEVERNVRDALEEILLTKDIVPDTTAQYELFVVGKSYQKPKTPVNLMRYGITRDVYDQIYTFRIKL